jgi:hypothetical protein
MAGYDTNEYSLITKIRTHSEISVEVCNNQEKAKSAFEYIYYKSIEFKNFTQYIPDNSDANKLSNQMVEMVKQGKDLYDKGEVSSGFCKIRLNQINRSAEQIQKVIGGKPR